MPTLYQLALLLVTEQKSVIAVILLQISKWNEIILLEFIYKLFISSQT